MLAEKGQVILIIQLSRISKHLTQQLLTKNGKENHKSSWYLHYPSTANTSQAQETSILSVKKQVESSNLFFT